MKSIKPHFIVAALFFSLLGSVYAGGQSWITDLNEGIELAKKENKLILAEFTGSDFCPPCKFMDKNVFSKEAFINKASEDYILVVIDAPKGDRAVAAKNEKYFVKYGVRMLPTVLLLDSDGNPYDKVQPMEHRTVEKFLNRIKVTKNS